MLIKSKKILTALFSMIFAFFVSFAGCELEQKNQVNAVVQDQLLQSNVMLERNDFPVKIVSFEHVSDIESDEELSGVQQEIIMQENVVPQFDGINKSTFSLNTIKERMDLFAKDATNEMNVVKNINDYVTVNVKKGDKKMRIVWESQGKQFTSICVYNEKGIVYDNIISNIVITKEKETNLSGENFINENDIVSGNMNVAKSNQTYSSTVINYEILWLWGGLRGEIIIKHCVLWNGTNKIIDHWGSKDAWMSAGDADAQWKVTYLSPYSYSKMAWAYGWATPTADFSIKYSASNLEFSTGVSGVGSKGVGDGVHVIYL